MGNLGFNLTDSVSVFLFFVSMEPSALFSVWSAARACTDGKKDRARRSGAVSLIIMVCVSGGGIGLFDSNIVSTGF